MRDNIVSSEQRKESGHWGGGVIGGIWLRGEAELLKHEEKNELRHPAFSRSEVKDLLLSWRGGTEEAGFQRDFVKAQNFEGSELAKLLKKEDLALRRDEVIELRRRL